MKAIITNTKQEAFIICAALDAVLGYPDPTTLTNTYTEPMKHSNETQWIVLVPNTGYEVFSKFGEIVDITQNDIYEIPGPQLF